MPPKINLLLPLILVLEEEEVAEERLAAHLEACVQDALSIWGTEQSYDTKCVLSDILDKLAWCRDQLSDKYAEG